MQKKVDSQKMKNYYKGKNNNYIYIRISDNHFSNKLDLLSEDGIIELLKNKGDWLKYIDSQTEEMIIAAISNNFSNIEFAKKLAFNVLKKLVEIYPDKSQKYMISKDGKVLKKENEYSKSIFDYVKKRVIIYGKRNIRVFKQENILKLFDLAQKNLCNIELMFFSPYISDDLLEEIRKSVPDPPKTIEEMRKTQIEYKEKYLEQKKKRNCNNIKYYESLDFPLFHFVVVDNKLYLGIVNYNKENGGNSVYDDRPYLEFNVLNKFARRILNKYSMLVKKSEDSKNYY